jgi:hypothetical protein
MSQKVTINGSYTLNNNGNTVNVNLTNTISPSGSLFNASSMVVATGSWQVVDQNKNLDFRTGVFSNEDFSSSIRLAVGSTGSFQTLWPQDSSTVNGSGSSTIWAQAIGSASLLTYMVVSLN